jgi:hypothetical protein
MAQRWWYTRSTCIAALITIAATTARITGYADNEVLLGAFAFTTLVLLNRHSVIHVTQRLSDVQAERQQLRSREEHLAQQINQYRAATIAMNGQRERLRVAIEDADRRAAEAEEIFERRLAEETEALRVEYENQKLLDQIGAYEFGVERERAGEHEVEPPHRESEIIHLDGHRRRPATGTA